MGEKVPPKRESRKFTLSRAQIKTEARTVELTFSSEEPVVRGWGIEILDHSPGAMRMDRAEKGIGVIEDEKIRLFWDNIPLWYNMGVFNYFEKMNGVVVRDLFRCLVSSIGYGETH